MSPYMQHARRHLPGGTDPIAGMGLDWCFGYHTSLTIPANGGSPSFIGLDSTNWWTSTGDTSIFELVDDGSGNLIPQINVDGIYLAILGLNLRVASAPAAGAQGMVTLDGGYYPIPNHALAGFYNEPGVTSYHCRPVQHSVINLDASGVAPPKSFQIEAAQNTGSDLSTSTNLTLHIIRTNPAGNSTF